MKKLSKVLKISALAAACAVSVGAYAENATQAAQNAGDAGGRWLTNAEMLQMFDPSSIFSIYTKKKSYIPKNITQEMPPTSACNTSKKGSSITLSVYACNQGKTYTTAVPVNKGHVPLGMMKVGSASNADNGDFVIKKAYVGSVVYSPAGEPNLDEDEGFYLGCVQDKATISKASAIAINTSSTVSNAIDSKDTYGSSSKVGGSVGGEISSTTTAEGGIPGIAKVTEAVTVKATASVTSEIANSHEVSTGSSLRNDFTNGSIETNTTVWNTAIPAGYLGASAQWMPYVEVYGLFEMARAIPATDTGFVKHKFPDGRVKFALASSFNTTNNEIGRTSNYWFGKLSVPVRSLNMPNGTKKAMLTGLHKVPMTVSGYVQLCNADIGSKTYAPNMKAGLCATGKYPLACK